MIDGAPACMPYMLYSLHAHMHAVLKLDIASGVPQPYISGSLASIDRASWAGVISTIRGCTPKLL